MNIWKCQHMCVCLLGEFTRVPGNSEIGPQQLVKQLRSTCKLTMPPDLKNRGLLRCNSYIFKVFVTEMRRNYVSTWRRDMGLWLHQWESNSVIYCKTCPINCTNVIETFIKIILIFFSYHILNNLQHRFPLTRTCKCRGMQSVWTPMAERKLSITPSQY